MRLQNIAGCSSVGEYVKSKADKLRDGEQSFETLFGLMFSERENVFWEELHGYRILKTTYGGAYAEVLRMTAVIKCLLGDIEQDCVIGLNMQNRIEWIELFWAILRCGARPLLMNTRLDKGHLEAALRDSGAAAVISDSGSFSVRTVLLDDIMSCKEVSAKADDVHFGTELLVMSSGTSDTIKLCAYSAEQVFCQLLNAEQVVGTSKNVKRHYEGELKLLTFLPFYHIFGLMAMYMWFAFYARTFVYLKDMSAQCILNTIRRHKVTHIFAVPLFWDKVYEQAMKKIAERGDKTLKKLERGLKISESLSGIKPLARAFRRIAFREVRDNLFGESVSFMITGGGAVRGEVLRFFGGIGYPLSNGYGMSEIGITSVELSEDVRILSSGSVGMPMQSVSYRINDKGELLTRGTSLCKCCYQGGRAVDINKEWFNTRDLAREENGRYYILGRADDLMVSSSGENINPILIEDKFETDGVKRVCLINAGKAQCAVPVLLVSVNRYLSQKRRDEIINEVRERLSTLKLTSEIKDIVPVGEELIREGEFKLNRKRLTAEFMSGKLMTLGKEAGGGGETRRDSLDDIEKQVLICFNKALGTEIGFKSDFFLDAGGTSLEYFTLLSYIRDEFDVSLELSQESKLTTPEDFCSYIKERL